ncbi:MAG: type IV toxin-antitoxin system AbiEi family antitoxin domain-containing protein [Motilibacteraceae bacterium]
MTYRQLLRAVAADQRGYVTVRDAHAAGVPSVEVRKIAARGGLEQVARGVYRFPDVARREEDLFLEAVLRVGPDAVIIEESVLALHHLAQVAPRRVKIATPRRVRLRDPGFIEAVTCRLAPRDLTSYKGIPSVTIDRALRDCMGKVMPERLLAAVGEAARRDLLTPREAAAIRRLLACRQAQTSRARDRADATADMQP